MKHRRHDYQSEFRQPLLFKIIPFFIGLTFVIIIAAYTVLGIAFYRVASNPNATANQAGHILSDFRKGYLNEPASDIHAEPSARKH